MTASPAPTATPTVSAYSCPSNDQTLSVASARGSAGTDVVHRAMRANRAPENTATGLLAVTYKTSALAGSLATAAATREQIAGGTMVHQLTFDRIGTTIHVLSVPVARMTTIAATLRTQAGVESVAPTGFRRSPSSATPDWTNDPYFNGFTALQNTQASNPAASTYRIEPNVEASNVPGQWDMHAIKLENAFGYSTASDNTAGDSNSGALGSASVKIAIIDTGEDPNHPELTSKIAYQKCYITNATGTAQSTSNFETDPDGHGTDVSGIAAADTNNSFGFTGTGGNVEIYAYRVFPEPDDSCTNDGSTDPRCSSDTTDIADAIDDAVTHGVNIISMSLGGESCTNGVDSDPTEGAAVAEAIAHNVIVVAAAGNSGGLGVSAPGCDTGVIAVGATSLADGVANGSGNALGSSATPVEYVASYSQYGSTNTVRSASSWGIVAPGGDPSAQEASINGTPDDLHWIENIWTTTPYQSSGTDESFVGECTDDYPNGTGYTSPVDCRTLIAGTSMATPHVAGAAALILSATGSTYQSPTAMKQLLCQTADDLTSSSSIQGCGRLNIYTAMATALGDPAPPTPIP